LTRIMDQVEELQRRQLALLSTVEGVSDSTVSSQLDAVRSTMAKVPEYSLVCKEIRSTMSSCDQRIASLAIRAGRLRSLVPQSIPFQEDCIGESQRDDPTPKGFAYRVCYRGGINVRSTPSLQAHPTGELLKFGTVVRASERRSPLGSGGDVFLCLLPEGRGWVLECFAVDRKPTTTKSADALSNTHRPGGGSSSVVVLGRVVLERISELAYAQAVERATAKAGKKVVETTAESSLFSATVDTTQSPSLEESPSHATTETCYEEENDV
jgi:hypothetical protein